MTRTEATTRELELIDQSKEDFRLGRTRSLNESKAYVDDELDRRRRLRTNAEFELSAKKP
jgi:hypothetical protein